MSVVPPGAVRERPQVELMCPGGSVLSGEMKVGFSDHCREQQAVMLLASGFSQFLEFLLSQHSPQRVRGVDCTVDHDMDDVNSF